MSREIIETKNVKVQASPVPEPELTPFKIYDAVCEVIEYSSLRYTAWNTMEVSKSIGKIYIITDDNGETQRFGSEFFNEIEG